MGNPTHFSIKKGCECFRSHVLNSSGFLLFLSYNLTAFIPQQDYGFLVMLILCGCISELLIGYFPKPL